MIIVPNSRIILLKTPFEMSDNNQLTFSNATVQYNYFNSLPKLELDNASYQRKDGVVRFPTSQGGNTYEDLIKYNYCMYQNTSYDNKWFYAYIDKITYINDGMSEISLITDTFQSWQFDIVYKQSFVEREHVNNDTVGLHTVPEGLETGEYVRQSNNESSAQITNLNFLNTTYPVCSITHEPKSFITSISSFAQYNNTFSGLWYVALKDGNSLKTFIKDTEETNDCEIYSIFMAPASLCNPNNSWTTTVNDNIYDYHWIVPSSTYTDMGSFSINKPSVIGTSYTPKNNKLFTFPYRYLIISNNGGGTANYHYEEFTTSTCTFSIKGAVSEGCDIRLEPQSYRGGERLHMLSCFKLPTCSWISDAYTNWLTANSVNNTVNRLQAGAQIIGGGILMATGVGAGAGAGLLATGVRGILDQAKSYYDHKIEPDEARGGSNQGNLNFAEKNGFTYYKMSIKDEYASIVDEFFSAYGYKVNSFKIPNVTGRLNWNYVKTIDINLTGDIPQEDMTTLRHIFDSGTTFWHNPATFLDYSQNNNII